MYLLQFYVPESHLESVKKALFAAGAGQIGSYDSCAWQTKGKGQFRPLDGSKPYLGRTGEVETVDEWKVELVCSDENLQAMFTALKKSHPYETPAYQVLKCLEV